MGQTLFQAHYRWLLGVFFRGSMKGMRCRDASGIHVGVGMRETSVLRCLAITGIVVLRAPGAKLQGWTDIERGMKRIRRRGGGTM